MKVSTKTLGVFLLSLMVMSLAGYNTASFGQAQAPPPQPLPGPRGTPIRPAPSAWNPKSIGYIKASNVKKDDQFGYTVALSADGNAMAVGTTAEDSAAKGINGNQADHLALNAGAVYVFNRSSGNWVQQAYVKASNAKASDQFGASLALSGDGNTLAVGATGESSSATGINGNQADTSMAGAGRHRRKKRGHGYQRRPVEQSGRRGWRRLRLHTQWQHLVATGLREAVEHHRPRCAFRLFHRIERQRGHAGRRHIRRRQRQGRCLHFHA